MMIDRAFLILCSLLLNAALAGPRRWYVALGLATVARYPAAWIRDAERRLNRDHRSFKERESRGMVLVVFVLAASLVLGAAGNWLLQRNFHFLEILFIGLLLPVRPTWDCVSQIRQGLHGGDLAKAKQALEDTAWKHHALMDEYGVARAGIEMLAVHFSEKILAPVLWYLVLGLPGLLMSKAIYLLQETLVRPGDSGQGFGKAARQAHAVLHYIPSRLAAVFWLAACVFMPAAKLRRAARQVSDGMKGRTPQAMSLLAAASVLGMSLGGPNSVYAQGGWIGNGTPKPMAADVKRGLMFFAVLHLFLFVFVGVLI